MKSTTRVSEGEIKMHIATPRHGHKTTSTSLDTSVIQQVQANMSVLVHLANVPTSIGPA